MKKIHSLLGVCALALFAFTGCIRNSAKGEATTGGDYKLALESDNPIGLARQLSQNRQREMLAEAEAEAIKEHGLGMRGFHNPNSMTNQLYCPNGICPQLKGRGEVAPQQNQGNVPAQQPQSGAPAAAPKASGEAPVTQAQLAAVQATANKALADGQVTLKAVYDLAGEEPTGK